MFVMFDFIKAILMGRLNMELFHYVMARSDGWDSVSFYRFNGMEYDISALRYPRINVNPLELDMQTRHQKKGLSDIRRADIRTVIIKDLEYELLHIKGDFYPVYSAFGGLAIYKLNYTEGCSYIGEYKKSSGLLVHDCEHVAFHRCMRKRNKARIVIFKRGIIGSRGGS